jgi:hypothetical protein
MAPFGGADHVAAESLGPEGREAAAGPTGEWYDCRELDILRRGLDARALDILRLRFRDVRVELTRSTDETLRQLLVRFTGR